MLLRRPSGIYFPATATTQPILPLRLHSIPRLSSTTECPRHLESHCLLAGHVSACRSLPEHNNLPKLKSEFFRSLAFIRADRELSTTTPRLDNINNHNTALQHLKVTIHQLPPLLVERPVLTVVDCFLPHDSWPWPGAVTRF
jgi:hypothetical protein